MASVLSTRPTTEQKVSRGQAFIRLIGSTALVSIGNVVLERMLKTETLEIRTSEDPLRPRLITLVTDLNEDLKITAKSFSTVIMALAQYAPTGDVWTQEEVTDGELVIPAGAKAGDVFTFKNTAGKRVLNVDVEEADRVGLRIDYQAGRCQTLVPQAVAKTVPFMAPAILAAAGKTMLRQLQQGEIRGEFVVRENNRYGDNWERIYPLCSFRATGGQKIIDDANEVTSIEIEVSVEYDFSQEPGKERGYAVLLG